MGQLFGTDGVRGIANKELTPELTFKIGQAGAYVLTKHKVSGRAKILVGKDTRISGDMLEAALSAGICSVGGEVVSLGVVPTPAVAYLTKKYGADAGVVISASHNPMEYNGIKFFNAQGYKLSDEIENEIESHIFEDNIHIEKPDGAALGICSVCGDAKNDYVDFICENAPCRFDGISLGDRLRERRILSGGRRSVYPLGAQVTTIHDKPDGTNINLDCGSTHMKHLCEAVKERGAQIGFAFDGDADRCLAVDESGAVVDGDAMMMICADSLKKQGKLANNVLVATVMSNLGLFLAAEEHGIRVIQTKVGDRYVLEEMVAGGHSIGGEQSGHVIYLDYNTTGDGLLSAVMLLGVMVREGKKLSELAKIITILPQVVVNAKVKNENKARFADDPEIAKVIAELNRKFHGKGRVLIRPSGTEPLVRVMIEGQDIDEITREANEIAAMIEQKFQ